MSSLYRSLALGWQRTLSTTLSKDSTTLAILSISVDAALPTIFSRRFLIRSAPPRHNSRGSLSGRPTLQLAIQTNAFVSVGSSPVAQRPGCSFPSLYSLPPSRSATPPVTHVPVCSVRYTPGVKCEEHEGMRGFNKRPFVVNQDPHFFRGCGLRQASAWRQQHKGIPGQLAFFSSFLLFSFFNSLRLISKCTLAVGGPIDGQLLIDLHSFLRRMELRLPMLRLRVAELS